MKIFISHSYEDSKLATTIKQKLIRRGIEVIEIDDNISVGDDLVSTIETSIRQADDYIILLTKSYEESKWSDMEQILIFDQKFSSKKNKRIFPILIDKHVKIPSLLKNIVYADLTNKDIRDSKLDEFIVRISQNEETQSEIKYQNMKGFLREQEELLKIKELEYKLNQNKQDRLRNSFKYSFLLVTVISALISLIFIIGKFDKPSFGSQILSAQSLVFYLLGFLTAIIPSIYILIKRKRNGK
jgi:hypothetical protein